MLFKIDAESVDLGDSVLVHVDDRVVIIDADDAGRLLPYKWYIRRSRYNLYAYRIKRTNGKKFMIWMHRQIMHCPNDQIVHHKNHYGLDNRKSNLEKMTEDLHHELHRFH